MTFISYVACRHAAFAHHTVAFASACTARNAHTITTVLFFFLGVELIDFRGFGLSFLRWLIIATTIFSFDCCRGGA